MGGQTRRTGGWTKGMGLDGGNEVGRGRTRETGLDGRNRVGQGGTGSDGGERDWKGEHDWMGLGTGSDRGNMVGWGRERVGRGI